MDLETFFSNQRKKNSELHCITQFVYNIEYHSSNLNLSSTYSTNVVDTTPSSVQKATPKVNYQEIIGKAFLSKGI